MKLPNWQGNAEPSLRRRSFQAVKRHFLAAISCPGEARQPT